MSLSQEQKAFNAAHADELVEMMRWVLKMHRVQDIKEACLENQHQHDALRKVLDQIRKWIQASVGILKLFPKKEDPHKLYWMHWWRRFLYGVDVLRGEHPRKMLVLMQCTFPQELMEVIMVGDRKYWWEWVRSLISRWSARKNLHGVVVENVGQTNRKISVRKHPLQEALLQKIIA